MHRPTSNNPITAVESNPRQGLKKWTIWIVANKAKKKAYLDFALLEIEQRWDRIGVGKMEVENEIKIALIVVIYNSCQWYMGCMERGHQSQMNKQNY